MGNYEFLTNYYPTLIEGFDVILGIRWLHILGTYVLNHDKGFIQFRIDRQKYGLIRSHTPTLKVETT